MNMLKIVFALSLITVALVGFASPAHALTDNLPASSWYAVVWNRDDDTLHWVNHVGEQASIPRPKLPNEAGYGVSFYISPNGRYMVIHGMLTNGRDGLGFYDLQTGAFLQTHEAQAGEIIVTTDHNPFTLNSQYVAVGLRTESAWRVIAFDATTGHSVGELLSNSASLPQGYIPAGHLPLVSLYDVDEGLGQYRVHVRFIPNGPVMPDVQQVGFSWIPALGLVQFDSIPANIRQFDVLGATGQIAYTMPDPMNNVGVFRGMIGHFDAPMPVFNQSNALVVAPKWVASGLMVAFRVAQEPYATMWHLMPAGGGQSIPFAPDYEYLYGTSDGFLIADVDAGHIKYSNSLQFEAFSPTVGNTVFSTNATFQVVYVTPIGAMFSLPLVSDGAVVGGVDVTQPNTPVPPVAGVNQVGGVAVAPAPTNTPVPPVLNIEPPVVNTPVPPVVVNIAPSVTATNPPRQGIGDGDCSLAVSQLLSVGIVGHVLDLGGTLALRTNLHDELPSHQIPGNSYVNIVGGPTCHKGHRMWRINFPMNGQIVDGYVSEGVNNMRFIGLP